VQPLTTTTYSLTGNNSFGCYSSAIQTIIVNPLPAVTIIASKTKLCEGETIFFMADGAVSYLWSVGTTTIFGQEITHTVSASDQTYSVVGTGTNGCTTTTFTTLQVNKCTGLENEFGNTHERYRVFPNPANNRITINADVAILTVEIYNTIGVCVLRQQNIDHGKTIDVSQLPKDIYYIKLFLDTQTFSSRILKE
jgi:hypothetical protein